MHRLVPLALILALASASGCATLEQIAALRRVDFSLDRVSEGDLAGVDLDRYRAGGSLSPTDAGRVALAIGRGELPLQFNLHVAAENPGDNAAAARLVRLDWTLFVEGTETVSGIYNDEQVIGPGQTADVAIPIQLDLVRFFGRNASDLARLALNLAGAGGSPANMRLEARPTVNTQFGPISYPGTISIEARVGR